MGKRGPAGKNRALKVLTGELPVTAANLGPVAGACGALDAPYGFSDEQSAAWVKTVEALRACGMMSQVDVVVLEAYCTSYVAWQKTEAELRKIEREKSFLASILSRGAQSSVVINPLVHLNSKLKAETVTYAAQLGMTPMSRLRMENGVIGVAEKKVNVFKRLKEERR
jgi:P27 family predicted phage terminase small subunit